MEGLITYVSNEYKQLNCESPGMITSPSERRLCFVYEGNDSELYIMTIINATDRETFVIVIRIVLASCVNKPELDFRVEQ